MHQRVRQLLVPACVSWAIASCGTPTSTTPPAPEFVNQAQKHHSYVPSSEHPADATRLIVVGDSISAHYGAASAALSYDGLLLKNSEQKWPAEANTSLSAKFGHDVELVNVAVAGSTTDNLAQQQTELEKQAPFHGHSIVTITIGGNDLQIALFGSETDPGGQPLNAATDNIREFITFLQNPAKFPDGTSIYLMAVYDPSDGEGGAEGCFGGVVAPQFVPALDQWFERYVSLGTELHFAVIDALHHFRGHGMNSTDAAGPYYDASSTQRWLVNDCIHPNNIGHNELRRLFFEAIDWSYVATP